MPWLARKGRRLTSSRCGLAPPLPSLAAAAAARPLLPRRATTGPAAACTRPCCFMTGSRRGPEAGKGTGQGARGRTLAGWRPGELQQPQCCHAPTEQTGGAQSRLPR